MVELRIGPRFRAAITDPDSDFWRVAANYDVVPVAFQSPDGTYRACNRSFENMVWTPAQDIVGRRPDRLFDQRVSDLLDQTFKTAKQEGRRAECAFWQRFKHGAYLYVECRMFPVKDEKGLVGIISDFLDATHLFLAEESLKTSLSILRHDLSSPLAGMGVILKEMRVLTRDAVSAVLQDEIVDLLDTCLALVRAWARVGQPENWMQRFPTGWIEWGDVVDRWRKDLSKKWGRQIRLNVSVPSSNGRVLWYSEHLVQLLTRVPELCCAEKTNRSLGTWSLSVEPGESGVRCRLHLACANLSEKQTSLSLFEDEAVLNALAHGAEISFSAEDGHCRVDLQLPFLELGQATSAPAEQPRSVVRDYDGLDFLSPDSLYCALFDLIGLCVGMFSDDGVLRSCSYWLAHALGTPSENLIGRHYRELFSSHIVRWLDGDFAECLRNADRKTTITSRIIPLSADGTAAWYEFFMSNAAEGGRTLVVNYVRERVQTRRLLQLVMEKGAGYLSDLLVRIRDRLRLLAERMQEHAPEQSYDIRLMMEETDNLMSVLNHWQRLFEIERGTYQLKRRSVDLLKVVRLAMFEQHLDVSMLQLDSAGRADEYVVQGDESLLHVLFQNLLSNAKRAAQREGGTLSIRLRREQDAIAIAVRNAGETPDFIRPIFFEKFVKGPDSTGMGLGTYSAKLVVDLHKGQIELDASEPGYTTVRVRLPVS